MTSLRPKLEAVPAIDPVRSKIMRSVKRADTKPEIIVRQVLHALGLRFRLHRKGLPGTPDLVLPKHRTVIFVHGCFWHRHRECTKASTPKTRVEFWTTKFDQNLARDARNVLELERAGWSVLTVWECETRNVQALRAKMMDHFDLNPVLAPLTLSE
jgi:DNA mismatch endonuclease, patch repair protein